MSPASVQEYLERMRERYRGASKRQRGALLDEVCAVTGYHRKASIRALGRFAAARKGRHGRAVVYGVAVVDALEQLWEASDRLCSKRLVGVLPDLVAALERHGELQLDPAVCAALLQATGVGSAGSSVEVTSARTISHRHTLWLHLDGVSFSWKSA